MGVVVVEGQAEEVDMQKEVHMEGVMEAEAEVEPVQATVDTTLKQAITTPVLFNTCKLKNGCLFVLN